MKKDGIFDTARRQIGRFYHLKFVDGKGRESEPIDLGFFLRAVQRLGEAARAAAISTQSLMTSHQPPKGEPVENQTTIRAMSAEHLHDYQRIYGCKGL